MLSIWKSPSQWTNTVSESNSSDYELVEALSDDQIEQLHKLMHEQWWGTKRSLADVRTMVENTSLMIGLVERSDGRLVGFCRVLTDFVFRATIYDVMVVEDLKGTGLGARLMDALSQHPKLQQVSLIYLACEPQLYPFYERWGFNIYEARSQWMLKTQHPE